MKDHRYIPSWPLPAYIFIPGVNPHPKKAGGHMEGQADPIAPQIDLKHPELSDYLRFSLDLFNHHYYWESHVYLEALWNAHHRQGSVADFLKALIKLAAAAIKLQLDQKNIAFDHILRAKELLTSVIAIEGDQFLGFNLKDLNQQLGDLSAENLSIFPLYPTWK